jgi:hypothetical protein
MKISSLKSLYEQDEHLWLTETIKLLKENRLEQLDIENLIEELEDLTKRDKNRVESFLRQITIHLLLQNMNIIIGIGKEKLQLLGFN